MNKLYLLSLFDRVFQRYGLNEKIMIMDCFVIQD